MKLELCLSTGVPLEHYGPDPDFIELLGGRRVSSFEVISNAFRRMAKILHPDANGGSKESEQLFVELSNAYTIMSDPEKRSEYFAPAVEAEAREAYAAYFGAQDDMAPGVHVFEGRNWR